MCVCVCGYVCMYVILISLYEVFDQTKPFQASKLGIGIVWKPVSNIGYFIFHFSTQNGRFYPPFVYKD